MEAGEFGNRDPDVEDGGEGGEGGKEVPVELNRYCGVDFIDAMLTCKEEKKCPMGNECGGGDVCVEDTNCDKPLVELKR